MAEQKTSTSQDKLAQEITDALCDRKLITENKRSKLPQQIAMGLLDADDWALLVDIATEQNLKENDLVKGND